MTIGLDRENKNRANEIRGGKKDFPSLYITKLGKKYIFFKIAIPSNQPYLNESYFSPFKLKDIQKDVPQISFLSLENLFLHEFINFRNELSLFAVI